MEGYIKQYLSAEPCNFRVFKIAVKFRFCYIFSINKNNYLTLNTYSNGRGTLYIT